MFKATLTAMAMLVALPAVAQQSRLTEDQARQFLDRSAQDTQRLVQEGDWAGVQNWYGQHLAEDAKLALRSSVLAKDGPAVTIETILDRRSITRFGQMMASTPQHSGPRSIQDFRIAVDVLSLTPLPNGEVAATVMFNESGTLPMPPAPNRQGQQDQATPAERIVFHQVSTCTMRLSADGNGTVKVEMTACEMAATIG
jgi:hypothetical protein